MKKILVTGSAGQIGSELTLKLVEKYGSDNVVATDLREAPENLKQACICEKLDVTICPDVRAMVARHDVGTIYHLAAILSAVGERKPQLAWEVNMNGLYNVLEASVEHSCAVFVPSSIAAFGPGTPKFDTPQDTIQRPTSIYGVTKVAGELLCDYYHKRYGIDTRGVRYPGIISYETLPGGGTTDYAVEIFFEAIKNKKYTCFLKADSRLDMMYMPDAIKASIELMEADGQKLIHRNAFNVTAFSFTPEELALEIKKIIPEFEIRYDVEPIRQGIADSWPSKMNDSAARQEWGWSPSYDLAAMTRDMIEKLIPRLK